MHLAFVNPWVKQPGMHFVELQASLNKIVIYFSLLYFIKSTDTKGFQAKTLRLAEHDFLLHFLKPKLFLCILMSC